MDFECEMISCSNAESKGYGSLWKIDSLMFIGKVFTFGNFKSSKIENISFKNNCITIDTQNTTYVFKEIKVNKGIKCIQI